MPLTELVYVWYKMKGKNACKVKLQFLCKYMIVLLVFTFNIHSVLCADFLGCCVEQTIDLFSLLFLFPLHSV